MLTALVAMLFQSTLPRRERHEYQRGKLRDYEISIHAPAKGATGGEKGHFGRYYCLFNPRSREGSDASG